MAGGHELCALSNSGRFSHTSSLIPGAPNNNQAPGSSKFVQELPPFSPVHSTAQHFKKSEFNHQHRSTGAEKSAASTDLFARATAVTGCMLVLICLYVVYVYVWFASYSFIKFSVFLQFRNQ